MIDVTAWIVGGALVWVGMLAGELRPVETLARLVRRRRDPVELLGPGVRPPWPPDWVPRVFTPPRVGSGSRGRGEHAYLVYGPSELSRAGLFVAWLEQHDPPADQVVEVAGQLADNLTFDVERCS